MRKTFALGLLALSPDQAGASAAASRAPLILLLLFLAFVLYKLLSRRSARSSLELSDNYYAPGATVQAWFETDKRPLETKAALELCRVNGSRPLRTVTASVGAPESLRGGWRCAVSAVLPGDAHPDFEGNWAITVEAKAENGGELRETAPLELRSFFLQPPGPRAPGAAIRALLETREKPPALKAELRLYRSGDGPIRTLPATVSAAEKAACGWRCTAEAVMPSGAGTAGEDQWILWVGDAAGGDDPQVDEEEPVGLLA